MKEMTSRERVLTALQLKVPDRVPWIESYIHKSLAENITGKKIAQYPGKPRIFPEVLDFLSLDNISYDLAPPRFVDLHYLDGMEIVGEGKLKTWADLEKYSKEIPDPHNKSFYKPLEEYLSKYRKDYAALGTIRFGPSNTYLSMGIEHFCLSLAMDPDLVDAVMDMFSNFTLKVLDVVHDFDIDVFYVSDDLAFKTNPFVSPMHMERFFMPYMRKVASRIEKPWAFHSCGNINPILDDLLSLGMSGISNLEPGPMDIFQLKKDYGDKFCLIGNIDMHYTLTRGTPEETSEEVRAKIEKVAPGGGYIMATANGLAKYCKPENIKAMNDTLLQYGIYPVNGGR